jgi:NADH-quinone oxidoreductase subunit E
MTSLAEQYGNEVQAILAKYPPDQKRSAVMPLLNLAQRRDGFVSKDAMKEIAALCGVTPTEVASIVGFYSLYYDEKKGNYRIQVCTDLCCALRGSEEFLHRLCEALGIPVGGTTPDGKITVEAVMCLAACDKAPMFQVQSLGCVHKEGLEYHENQTVESALALIEELRQK